MKIVVVGLGTIGKVHVKILEEQGLTITAVCDIDKEKLEKYSRFAKYTNYIEMLEKENPDVVHICTPHYLHADMVISALERNINVLCEKPLCIKEEDIPRILSAECNSKAKLGVCLQNRYNKANLFVKEYLKDKTVTDGTAFVVWHRDADYYASANWRGKYQTEGGGLLINQALHTLDLMQWFVGMPDYVTASISNLTLKGKIEVEDTAAAIFSGNVKFNFFATNGSASDFPVDITLKTKNEIIKIFSDKVIIDGQVQSFNGDARIFGKYCYGTGHEKLIADFYDCIKNGKQFLIDGKEGTKVVKLVLSSYKSKGEKTEIIY